MTPPVDLTTAMLTRWHAGDQEALHELIDRDASWVHQQVRRRLGNELRQKLDSVDVVQDAMLEVLRYAPRFVAPDQPRFRALMVKVVENILRDRHAFFHARRRSMSRDAGAEGALAIAADSADSPSREAASNEETQWMRLGLELLDPDDRRAVVLRQWDELGFAEIGERMGLTENGARMKFQRAVAKLARKVSALRTGSWLEDETSS